MKTFQKKTRAAYTLMDHTADLGIRVTAPDREQVYAAAALAMLDLINPIAAADAPADLTVPAPPPQPMELNVEGQDRADLMVNFLREILYLFNGKNRRVTDLSVTALSDRRLDARLFWHPMDPETADIRHDIKAVTYHEIDVTARETGWAAQVVFDV